MLGRHSKSAVIEKSMAETSSRAVEKAAETVSELAERAIVAAREAQRVASPGTARGRPHLGGDPEPRR